jgi:two-component system nitrogen regulation response regulator NtrX
LIEQVAPTDARVLILGESGTGKELVAHAIHRASRRATKPFITVNCAAIPRDLVESEMFGHEKGSFTGATDRRLGRFELAHGGTLFLDEVGDLSMEAQAKLLRVLEGGEVSRLGSERTIRVDVRVIAATNQRLPEAVAAGSFREDLYFRLNVFPIEISPLRARLSDLTDLVPYLTTRARSHETPTFTAEAFEILSAYDWPGNVRELANVVERLTILGGGEIDASMVGQVLPKLRGGRRNAAEVGDQDGDPFDRSLSNLLDDYERSLISRAITRTTGNVAEAARLLQTDRANLYRRMKRLGIS